MDFNAITVLYWRARGGVWNERENKASSAELCQIHGVLRPSSTQFSHSPGRPDLRVWPSPQRERPV